MEHNFWGEPIVSPRDLVLHQDLADAFKAGAFRLFRKFEIARNHEQDLVDAIWRRARDSTAETFEMAMKDLVSNTFNPSLIRSLLDERAAKVAGQIAPFISPGAMLDLGCGDGMVSWHLRERVTNAVLIDVVPYVDDRVGFQFMQYRDGDPLPTTAAFEDVLLINVLHHSKNPTLLLEQAWNSTSHHLIVIESVYADAARMNTNEMPFALPPREQFLYTAFFDWFYNRVLHSDVPVPFNYASPSAWRSEFALKGMTLKDQSDLGIDMDIVPIHHYLFVLRK